jgi:hypothetical protein
MKILYLTLKGKWFDMIDEEIKLEEYRDIKPFWIKRLVDCVCYEQGFRELNASIKFKNFTHVRFARGGHFHSSLPQRTFELKGIRLGTGKTEWGAVEGVEYFCLQIGKKAQ